jgi:hypothetical protein
MNPRLIQDAQRLAVRFTQARCPTTALTMRTQPPSGPPRQRSFAERLFGRSQATVAEQPVLTGWLVTAEMTGYEEKEWGPRDSRGYCEKTLHRDIYLATDGRLMTHTYRRAIYPPSPEIVEGVHLAPTSDADIYYLDRVTRRRDFKQVKDSGRHRAEGWSLEATNQRRHHEDGDGLRSALTDLRRRLLGA